MQIKSFEFNLFGENTYLIWDDSSKQAAAIDPGMMNYEEDDEISKFIEQKGLVLKYILLTHAHIDHTFGIEFLKNRYHAGILGSKADYPLAQQRAQQAKMFHLRVETGSLDFDEFIRDGRKLFLGNEEIQVIATPGHSPGGVCFYIPEDKILISGDTLFRRSIGRTDLPGGDHATLIASVNKILNDLPADTIVYPGHGPATTIGEERKLNPFVN